MSFIKNYVCSAQAGCNQTFTKYTDLKKHEAAHSPNAHVCRFPGCDFVTLSKPSFEIHSDRHTGEQRYECPQGCGFKTHNPAALTRHRKIEHGHVPPPRHPRRSGRTAAPSASHMTPLTSLQPRPQLQPQPQLPAAGPANQPQQNNINNMMGVFQARPNIVQAYTGPARAANGWQAPAAPPYYQYNPALFYGQAGAANGYAGMYAGPAGAANGWAGYPAYPYRQY